MDIAQFAADNGMSQSDVPGLELWLGIASRLVAQGLTPEAALVEADAVVRRLHLGALKHCANQTRQAAALKKDIAEMVWEAHNE
jgi:hypothetical protein